MCEVEGVRVRGDGECEGEGRMEGVRVREDGGCEGEGDGESVRVSMVGQPAAVLSSLVSSYLPPSFHPSLPPSLLPPSSFPPPPSFPCFLPLPQLYIKVSEDVDQQQSGSGTEDSDSQSSVMVLLDPHLPDLSQYWLAALRDHAHLSLPPQFLGQLPPSGGMFYSTNVMESVRPYFEQNWPSLLHAAAIWLQTTGLKEKAAPTQTTLQPLMPEPLLSSSKSSTSIMPSDLRWDRLHLILGLAVQTLCTPATLDHPPITLHCLKALQRLLKAAYVQHEIGTDTKLAIEVLHLLHRLLLTCQSPDLHVIIMHIAQSIGCALQGKEGEEGTSVEAGEASGEEEELEPGKSHVFALLEVTACCLLRLVPDLKPKELESAVVVTRSRSTPSHDELTVASQAVSLLVTAVSLCSPRAMEAILPTVLHIFLHTTKYAAQLQPLSAPLLSSCLHSLQQLCSGLPLTDQTHGPKLSLTLRAALTSLLGVPAGPDDGETSSLSQIDREVKLLLMAILLHVPSPSLCPPATPLFESCVQLFRECLFSPASKVSQQRMNRHRQP